MCAQNIKILDVVHSPEDEKFLFTCLTSAPFRQYRKRARYLEEAVVRGLQKEILFVDRDAVGQIEFAPAEVSFYPISGDGVCVMNCVWVRERAKGHRYGKMLVRRMIEASVDVAGFATVALEGHYSKWLRLWQMEYLGFCSIDSKMMRHKVKRRDICFRVHLMWMPLKEGAEPPVMDWKGMLRGVDFCIGHPLYRADRLGLEEVYEMC